MKQTARPSTSNNLKQQIYQDLRNRLIHCVYPPGTTVNELLLTEEYNVSRTPIREAVSQLERDGYVKVLPKKGIYISDISIDDAVQIFRTRIAIEPITLKMAIPFLDTEMLLNFKKRFEKEEEDLEKASALDMEMHLYLVECSRNAYLIDMMRRLFDDNTRMIIFTGQNKVKIHNAKKEHLEILDSLISMQEPDISAGLLKKHIETCLDAALKYFSSDEYLQHHR